MLENRVAQDCVSAAASANRAKERTGSRLGQIRRKKRLRLLRSSAIHERFRGQFVKFSIDPAAERRPRSPIGETLRV